MGILIKDIVSYLPNTKIDNYYFEKIMDTSHEWITKRTGIHQRHFGEETAKDMAVLCAKNLKEKHPDTPISLVVAASFTDRNRMPSISASVANACDYLGNVRAFDINLACSGFVAALDMAEKFLEVGEYGLVVGAEQISPFLDMTDRGTAILFGDGAGAVLVQKTDSPALTDYEMVEDIGYLALNPDGKITMDGREVFKFAVSSLKKSIRKMIDACGEPDYIICHQANERIIDHVSHALNISPTKFYKNITEVGNTSAASIPLCLSQMKENQLLKTKVSALTCGFGAGLTYYSKYVEIECNDEF